MWPAPDYLARHPAPLVPLDLHDHNCIRFRLPMEGTIAPWVFTKDGQRTEIAVDGSLTVNDAEALLTSTLDGVGVGLLPDPMVAIHIAQGRLILVLEELEPHPARRFPLPSKPSPDPDAPARCFFSFVEKWRKGRPGGPIAPPDRVMRSRRCVPG